MGYTLDPQKRSNEFVSKAYDLYLKKLYKGKESIKSVRVITKEVPAGKTIEELTSLGFLPKPRYSDVEVPYSTDASSKGLEPTEEAKPVGAAQPILEPAPEIVGSAIGSTMIPPRTEQPKEPVQQERVRETAPKSTSTIAKPLIHFYDDMLNTDISRKEGYVRDLRKIANASLKFAKLRRINNFLTGYEDQKLDSTLLNIKVFKELGYTSKAEKFKLGICSFKQLVQVGLGADNTILLEYNFNDDYLEEKYSAIVSIEQRLSELTFIMSNKLFQKTIADGFKIATRSATSYSGFDHLKGIPNKIEVKFKYIKDRKSGIIAHVSPSEKIMFFDLFDYKSPTYEGNEKYERYKNTIRHECYHLSQVGVITNSAEYQQIGKANWCFKLMVEGMTVFSISDHIYELNEFVTEAEKAAALVDTEAEKAAARKSVYEQKIKSGFFRVVDSFNNLSFSYGGALAFWIWFWKKYKQINPTANFVDVVVKPVYNKITSTDTNVLDSSMTILANMLNLPLALPMEIGNQKINYDNARIALMTACISEIESTIAGFIANMNSKQDYAALGSSFFSTLELPIEHSGQRDPKDYLPNYDVMVEDNIFFGAGLPARFNGGNIKKRYEGIIKTKNVNQIIFIAMDSFGSSFIEKTKEMCSFKERNDKAIIYYVVLFSTSEDADFIPRLPFWDFNNPEEDFISIEEEHIMYARIKYESEGLTSLSESGPDTDLEEVLKKIPNIVVDELDSPELAKGNLLIAQSIAST
jgi:hypothetical protein